MAESFSSTPVTVHLKEQCIVCSLVFSTTELTPSGRKIKSNFNMNKKLKCNKQVIHDLKTFIGGDIDISESDCTFICIKCCRQVSSLLKKEDEVLKSKGTIRESVLSYLQIHIPTTRRLLQSTSPQDMEVFQPKLQMWLKTKSPSDLKAGNMLSVPGLASCNAQSPVPSHRLPLISDNDGKMDIYVLTIMVTLEQEKAIQELFGSHGWEFSKIKINRDDVDKDDNYEDEGDDDDCNVDTETLEDYGIFVKEEVGSDIEHTDVNTSRNSIEVEISGKGKRQAQTSVETGNRKRAKQETNIVSPSNAAHSAGTGNSEVKSDGEDKEDSEVKSISEDKEDSGVKGYIHGRGDITDESDTTDKSDSEVKLEELSGEEQKIDGPLVVLETLPDIDGGSKVASSKTHAVEIFQKGPTDVAETGYSASLTAYFCEDCQYTFPEATFYKLHKEAGKCAFQCQFCNERFTFKKFTEYQEHLKHHRAKDDNGKDASQKMVHFVCPICTKKVCSIYNMVRHVENVHTLQKNIYRCPQCYLTFETKELLMTHKKTHQSICPDCGKFYSSASSLNVHMKKIHSDRKYHCLAENCLYVATSKQALDFHMNRHSGSKPYNCKHCGKSYQRKDSCSRHQLLCVSGVTCGVCNARLGSRGALSAHQQAVHSDERFQCFCGSVFKYRTNLLRHRKTAGHAIPDQENERDTGAVLL